MIPWMFDTQAFAEKAATIAKEKADALAKQELEELQVSLLGSMEGWKVAVEKLWICRTHPRLRCLHDK